MASNIRPTKLGIGKECPKVIWRQWSYFHSFMVGQKLISKNISIVITSITVNSTKWPNYGTYKPEAWKLLLFVCQGYFFAKCLSTFCLLWTWLSNGSEHKTTSTFLYMSQNPNELNFPILITSWTSPLPQDVMCSLSSALSL